MLLSLFLIFFKIGIITIGGGYAMIANIREEIIEKKAWLDDDELMQVITIAESTPGPIAINMATYIGYKKGGFWGSLLATLGVILPSLIIIFTISLFLDWFMANKYVAYAFVGIKCAVAFLIVRAGLGMVKKLKGALQIVIFSLVFVAMILFELFSVNCSSIFLILGGGIVGIFAYALLNKKAKPTTTNGLAVEVTSQTTADSETSEVITEQPCDSETSEVIAEQPCNSEVTPENKEDNE
ncbi:MAG: chromate transporter [Clostridia bacterium]|nr:chromate transporter [Clostridia bacterium]